MKRPTRKPPRLKLSPRMVEVRELHGWNQGQLAAFLGCDRTQVSRWESGALCAVPHVGRLLELARRMPTPFATACLTLQAPVEPADLLNRVLGRWVWPVIADEGRRPSRTLGRVAVAVGVCDVFAPDALGVLMGERPGELD